MEWSASECCQPGNERLKLRCNYCNGICGAGCQCSFIVGLSFCVLGRRRHEYGPACLPA